MLKIPCHNHSNDTVGTLSMIAMSADGGRYHLCEPLNIERRVIPSYWDCATSHSLSLKTVSSQTPSKVLIRISIIKSFQENQKHHMELPNKATLFCIFPCIAFFLPFFIPLPLFPLPSFPLPFSLLFFQCLSFRIPCDNRLRSYLHLGALDGMLRRLMSSD